jgi:hypothetical protein
MYSTYIYIYVYRRIRLPIAPSFDRAELSIDNPIRPGINLSLMFHERI